jgi:hypothetical protein
VFAKCLHDAVVAARVSYRLATQAADSAELALIAAQNAETAWATLASSSD